MELSRSSKTRSQVTPEGVVYGGKVVELSSQANIR